MNAFFGPIRAKRHRKSASEALLLQASQETQVQRGPCPTVTLSHGEKALDALQSPPARIHDDDRSLDLGLLGLVGLAGLFGLRRRDPQDVSRTASNRSATSRA